MEKHSIISDIDAVPPFSMEKHSLNIQQCPPFPWKKEHSLVSDIDAVPPFCIKNHSLIRAHHLNGKAQFS